MRLIIRHLGPGPHPSGTPQAIHGKKGPAQPIPVTPSVVTVQPVAPVVQQPATASAPPLVQPVVAPVVPPLPAPQAAPVVAPQELDFGFYESEDNQRAKDWASGEFDVWFNGLPGKRRDALHEYSGSKYGIINKPLREGADPATVPYTAELDAALTHELKNGMTVYRGMQQEYLEGLQVGDVYADRGYTSVSINKRVAHGAFSLGNGLRAIIHLPSGTRCGTTEPTEKMARGEAELLIARGGRYKILSRSGGGMTEVVEMEAMPG